jgi:hypothetical protein
MGKRGEGQYVNRSQCFTSSTICPMFRQSCDKTPRGLVHLLNHHAESSFPWERDALDFIRG